MNAVDPLVGKFGKGDQVLVCGEPLRLETAHLARRSCAALSRFAADNPAHRRIVTKALGVVHVLISGKPTKYRLPQQTHQRMAPFLPVRTSASVSPAIA